jgi:hypothetical protein
VKVISTLSTIFLLVITLSFSSAFTGALPMSRDGDETKDTPDDVDNKDNMDLPINGSRLNRTGDEGTPERVEEQEDGPVNEIPENIIATPYGGKKVGPGFEIIIFGALIWLAFAFLGKKRRT